MYDYLTEITRYFKRGVETHLADLNLAVVLSPSSRLLDEEDLAVIPSLALQGPGFLPNEEGANKRIDQTTIGKNDQDVDINRLKKSRTVIDVGFRIRLFTDSLMQAISFVGRLIQMGEDFAKVSVPYIQEGSVFSGEGTVNINFDNHGFTTGDEIEISDSSDIVSLSDSTYLVTVIDENNFSVSAVGSVEGGTCNIRYGELESYNVYFGKEYSDDALPNFSDLKHYESTVRIEQVEIETSLYTDVFASSNGLVIESGGI